MKGNQSVFGEYRDDDVIREFEYQYPCPNCATGQLRGEMVGRRSIIDCQACGWRGGVHDLLGEYVLVQQDLDLSNVPLEKVEVLNEMDPEDS